ncbi:MAG: type II secretion system protein [Sedimentisphaeraceae bacterium JB056]
MKQKKAFTLIELLVVISIIAILMSILMPAMTKVRSQAKALVCGTRLKDIAPAVNMYINDNNGDIPASFAMSAEEAANDVATTWIDRIASYYYMKNTADGGFETSAHNTKYFRCPTQEYVLKMEKEAVNSNSPYMTSPKTGIKYKMTPGAGTYGMNAFFSGRGAVSGYKELNFRKYSKIKGPSSVPMVSDVAAEARYGGYNGELSTKQPTTDMGGWYLVPDAPHPIAYLYGWTGDGYEGRVKDNYHGPAAVHEGKINYMFSDGHVELKKNVWPWSDNDDTKSKVNVFHPQGKREEPKYW